jgi:Holliday junction resolvase RusA-like endonuclease
MKIINVQDNNQNDSITNIKLKNIVSWFSKDSFHHGNIKFEVRVKPVSLQNKGEKRADFKRELQKITKNSKYIITGICWIAIDYYCQHIKREKNPSVYDIDNIVKPIIDGLVGKDGLLIDDVMVNRVTVNWIDTPHDDYFEVEIEYPDLLFTDKSSLVFLKSESGWCFPSALTLIEDINYINLMEIYFRTWDSINTEEDYYKNLDNLPIQNFIYYAKIKDKGFDFIELTSVKNNFTK